MTTAALTATATARPAPRGAAPAAGEDLLPGFGPREAALWGHHPLRFAHALHRSPLLSRGALAALVDAYPRSGLALMEVGRGEDRRRWREGALGDTPGAAAIDAIEAGSLWLNLRNAGAVDARLQALVDRAFAGLSRLVPGFVTQARQIGILISSPGAQVPYHLDMPGQSLWQVEGEKTALVYPAGAPFLARENLERAALSGHEFDIPYEAWFDDHAVRLPLRPGEALHWPLNAPHRVENGPVLNVSITVEHWNEALRRSHAMNAANGLLRARFGLVARSRATAGPGFQAKRALRRLLRGAPAPARAPRVPAFRLDPARPGRVIDLPGAGGSGVGA